MSNSAEESTKMTDHERIVQATKAVLRNIDPEIAEQITIQVGRRIGTNELEGNYGIDRDYRGVDIKLAKSELIQIMIKRLEQEVIFAQSDAEELMKRSESARSNGDNKTARDFMQKSTELTNRAKQIQDGLENLRDNPSMYADVGFRFDKQTGTYSYVYDQDYDRHHLSGFGKTFADDVGKAYAALEALDGQGLKDLGAQQEGDLQHMYDDEKNPAMGCAVLIDEDTLKAILSAEGTWQEQIV